jgi:acyl dehydratase
LFAGVAGDFSPLTIEARPGYARVAPPALLVAIAVGLGSVDMPVPYVAEWDWLNWKFPRPVHAGDTIYARWTLTQKRPPVGGSPTSIVVWRVDVLTADGVLCAEGEVGASVQRRSAAAAKPKGQEAATQATGPAARRRRRRRPANGGNGQKTQPDGSSPVAETPTPAVAPAPAAKPERAAGQQPARRRRRRRSPGTPAQGKADTAPPTETPAAAASPPRAATPVATASAAAPANTLSRVIRRLRPRRT